MAADQTLVTMINSGAQNALSALAERRQPPLSACAVEKARLLAGENDALLSGECQPVRTVEMHEINSGGYPLAVTAYRGMNCPDEDASCIVYVHGGGWVLGTSRSHDVICRRLANAARCVVLCPDYRLAPEFRFPTGLNDVVHTLEYAHQSAVELGVSQDLIGISGDSAGGNLATVAAGLASLTDRDPLVAQLLFYPNTEASLSFGSYQTYADGFGLTTTDMRWFRDHYIDSPSLVSDWRISPLLNENLGGYPSTHLVIAGLDILRDEGIAYGNALDAAGVVTDLRIMPDLIHGSVSRGKYVEEANSTVELAAEFFSKRVRATRADRL